MKWKLTEEFWDKNDMDGNCSLWGKLNPFPEFMVFVVEWQYVYRPRHI